MVGPPCARTSAGMPSTPIAAAPVVRIFRRDGAKDEGPRVGLMVLTPEGLKRVNKNAVAVKTYALGGFSDAM